MAVILLLIMWQAAVWLWRVPGWLLPGPLQIGAEGRQDISRVFMHTSATLQTTLLGFAVGTAIGLLLAVLLHAVLPQLKPSMYPLLVLSQNIPIIALAPLLVIWFGYGLLPKIIIITLVCFFPITIATLEGLTQTDRGMMNYMKMIGASQKQIFWKLELPHALPYVFSGLKISATYSVMGAVIAEWIGAKQGLGVYMMLSKSAFRTDRVFVAIAFIVVMSLALFALIGLVERMFIRWKPHQKEGRE